MEKNEHHPALERVLAKLRAQQKLGQKELRDLLGLPPKATKADILAILQPLAGQVEIHQTSRDISLILPVGLQAQALLSQHSAPLPLSLLKRKVKSTSAQHKAKEIKKLLFKGLAHLVASPSNKTTFIAPGPPSPPPEEAHKALRQASKAMSAMVNLLGGRSVAGYGRSTMERDDLQARLREVQSLVDQGLQALQPPLTPAPSPSLTDQDLLEAIRALDRKERHLGLVPIWRLDEPPWAGWLEAALRRLEKDRLVELRPHNDPSSVPPDQRKGSLADPVRGLLFYVSPC